MENSSLLISYKNKLYDLTKFQHKHPGGKNTLKGLNNTDMRQRFESAPPHSDAAMYLLNEYEVENNNRTRRNGVGNGTANNAKNGLENESLKSKDINSNTIEPITDESMEVSVINYNREIVYFIIKSKSLIC